MTDYSGEVTRFIVDNFLFGEACELSAESSLLSQGILDSTGVLELVAYLEATYKIAIPDDEIVPENLDSIQAITGYIRRKRGES